MKQTNDPKDFRSMDDAPVNTGNSELEYDEIRPQGIVRNMYDEDDELEDENERERNDVFGNDYNENTERFD